LALRSTALHTERILAQYEQGDGELVAVYPVDVWVRIRRVPDLDVALLEAGETGGLGRSMLCSSGTVVGPELPKLSRSAK